MIPGFVCDAMIKVERIAQWHRNKRKGVRDDIVFGIADGSGFDCESGAG